MVKWIRIGEWRQFTGLMGQFGGRFDPLRVVGVAMIIFERDVECRVSGTFASISLAGTMKGMSNLSESGKAASPTKYKPSGKLSTTFFNSFA